MKSKRREFLKLAGLTGFGVAGVTINPGFAAIGTNDAGLNLPQLNKQVQHTHVQYFNMSGFAAPKINMVRVGIIGLGQRGPSHVQRMSMIEGVEIKALCDLLPEKAEAAKKKLEGTGHNPVLYSGSAEAWKTLCERDDLDLVIITTPWYMHAGMGIYAMEHGKHAATEVPAALTIDECWQLVETSEKTKKHCMMLENCCYDFFELLTLNMVRQGYFGELIHADAGYLHHQNNFPVPESGDMWRIRESQHRNANLYPSHGLGPVCQAMDINRGDRLLLLTSMASNDFTMGKMASELAKKDPFYKEFDTKSYRGNMNSSLIRTQNGKTIMLQYDITSPRVYSRIHSIVGTKGIFQKYPLPGRISQGKDDWFSEDEMAELTKKYNPEIIKRMGELAKEMGGHGGMDFLMNWRLIDCLRNGLPVEQDVYDAASWSAIIPCSEWSVANGSNSIRIPDFTCGTYKTNGPLDISMSQGGNTTVRPLPGNS